MKNTFHILFYSYLVFVTGNTLSEFSRYLNLSEMWIFFRSVSLFLFTNMYKFSHKILKMIDNVKYM